MSLCRPTPSGVSKMSGAQIVLCWKPTSIIPSQPETRFRTVRLRPYRVGEHFRFFDVLKNQSSFGRPRIFFDEDRSDFAVSLRIFEPRVGRLGRRIFGATSARATSSFSRARTSARFASCVRCTRDVRIKTPSCVARFPANARRRCRTSAGSEGDCRISKRNCTAVETLLTFWPPGPDARTKVNVSSESGINMGKCYSKNTPEAKLP
jgi:hypothetical protein